MCKHFHKAHRPVSSPTLAVLLISKYVQFIESSLVKMCLLQGYVLKKQRKCPNLELFIMEKNENYKLNFYFICYVVLRLMLHSLAIE